METAAEVDVRAPHVVPRHATPGQPTGAHRPGSTTRRHACSGSTPMDTATPVPRDQLRPALRARHLRMAVKVIDRIRDAGYLSDADLHTLAQRLECGQ